jgi:hypothetical protein
MSLQATERGRRDTARTQWRKPVAITAALSGFCSLLVTHLYREALPSELGILLLAPLSMIFASLAAVAMLRWRAWLPAGWNRRRWLAAAVFLVLGVGGFAVVDAAFVKRLRTPDGGDIAVLLAGERSSSCKCPAGLDTQDCLKYLLFEELPVDDCWPRRRGVRLGWMACYFLILGGLGAAVGLLFAPAGSPDEILALAASVTPVRQELYLRLDRTEDGLYRAVLQGSEGREVSERVSLAPLLEQGERLPLQFAESGVEGPPARRLGGALFEAVFQNELRGALRGALERAAASEPWSLRLRINLQEVPELADLPWECLYDRRGEGFLALSRDTPIVRTQESLDPLVPLLIEPPLRILLMISAPTDYGTLDAEAEWSRIRGALEPLMQAGLVEVERLGGSYEELLLRLLRRQGDVDSRPVHVFHFIGHGGFSEQRQEGVLVFEDAQRRGRPAGVEALAEALAAHRSVRLAVLNACNGARASRSDTFSGAAQTLLQRGMPAVVAMQSEVTDDTALAFAEWFYRAVAGGLPVDAAVSEVRNLLSGRSNPEWGAPVLYLRCSDARLFDFEGQLGPS